MPSKGSQYGISSCLEDETIVWSPGETFPSSTIAWISPNDWWKYFHIQEEKPYEPVHEGQSHQMGFQVLVLNVSLNPDIYSTLICTWIKMGAMYSVLWKSGVVSLCEKLKNMCYYVFFDNFFTRSKLLIMLSEMGIYATETVRANRKQMLNFDTR